MVRIISESSVAAGVRRIEAVTGRAVEDLMNKQQDFLTEIRALFNNAPDLISTIQKALSAVSYTHLTLPTILLV